MIQSYYIGYQSGYVNKGIAKFGNMETPTKIRIWKLLRDLRCQENNIEIMPCRDQKRRKNPKCIDVVKYSKIWVSKETVVLRRWEIETEIYFIKRVDKGRMATVKDLESWRFER